MAAVLALLSIAGCAQYVGKGKAPHRRLLPKANSRDRPSPYIGRNVDESSLPN